MKTSEIKEALRRDPATKFAKRPGAYDRTVTAVYVLGWEGDRVAAAVGFYENDLDDDMTVKRRYIRWRPTRHSPRDLMSYDGATAIVERRNREKQVEQEKRHSQNEALCSARDALSPFVSVEIIKGGLLIRPSDALALAERLRATIGDKDGEASDGMRA